MKKAKLLSITMIILVVLSLFAFTACDPGTTILTDVPIELRGRTIDIIVSSTQLSNLQEGDRYLSSVSFTPDGSSMTFTYKTCTEAGNVKNDDPATTYGFVEACALQGSSVKYGGAGMINGEWTISSFDESTSYVKDMLHFKVVSETEVQVRGDHTDPPCFLHLGK